MDEEVVFIQYNNENQPCDTTDLKLHHGKIELIDSCLYKVIFYAARGGDMVLFGKVVNDHKAQTQNVVSIYKDSALLDQLSYIDIQQLKFINKDTLKIFLYP